MPIVDRISLLNDLKACLPGVDKGLNASIEGFDTFWFDDTHVHSFNRIVATSVPCTALGVNCAVKAKDFIKLLSKYKAPTIEIEAENGCLKWKCGRGSGSITTLDPSIKERINSLDIENCNFVDVPKDLLDGIKLCYIPKNPSKYKSVAFKGKNVYSTDGIRINVFSMSSELGFGVYLDEVATKILCSLPDPVHIGICGNWVHFRYDTGMVFSATMKNFADFPESVFLKWISMSVKKDSDISGNIPLSVADVVERVSIFSDTTTGRSPITLTMREREMVLHARKDEGEITETVSLDVPFESDPNISMVIDAPFLAQISNKATKFYLTELSGKPAIVFHSEGYMQIVNLTPPKRTH